MEGKRKERRENDLSDLNKFSIIRKKTMEWLLMHEAGDPTTPGNCGESDFVLDGVRWVQFKWE